ncbi:hypothetical protein ACFX13_028382 [Malus domestica]
MQQPAGGRSKTHYGGAGEMSAAKAAVAEQGQLVVEAGSPISSRLPASAMVNLDELMTYWGILADPELQRKKKVASYKMYSVDGKMNGSFRKSFRWLKDKYTQVLYGW